MFPGIMLDAQRRKRPRRKMTAMCKTRVPARKQVNAKKAKEN